MTTLALPLASPPAILSELIARQRTLALYGFALLALTAAALVAAAADPHTLASGVGIWVKPAKFLFSVSVFTLTAAWFFGYVRPERRQSRPMRATVAMLLFSGTFELAWIVWQGAHGLESHFNDDTLLYQIMFALMGLFAVLLTATALPLAWEIGRRPARGLPGDFIAAVAVGLVLTFVLGAGFGIAIAANGSHAVGVEGGHVPILGWNRSGGDLRIAHFVGIHAQQALPILAALAGAVAAPRHRWPILLAGTGAYVAVAIGLFVQARAGLPLFPL